MNTQHENDAVIINWLTSHVDRLANSEQLMGQLQ